MLMNVLGQWLIIHLKKVLWKKKKKKKAINVLPVFSISHKSDVKTFLKLIVNYCPKGNC